MSFHGSTSKSTPSSPTSPHKNKKSSFSVKDVILDPGDNDDYEDYDLETYEESRIEMNNVGHNLTSVLMNPRKTFIEDMMDEFAAEQRVPIDTSTSTTTTSSSLSMSSSHSHTSNSYHSSTHSNASISSNLSISSTSNSVFGSSFTLFTTKAEDEHLSFVMSRIVDAYQEYLKIHEVYNMIVARREHNPMNTSTSSNSKYHNNSNMISHDELLQCFREVPEIFFRPEFTLQNIDMFNLAMGTKFTSVAVTSSLPSHNVSPSSRQMANTPMKRNKHFDDDRDVADPSLIEKQHQQIPKNQQEQLTKYLDIIELALLNNIWIRSPSFFRVLDDIRALQSLVATGYSHITSLRSRYRILSETIAVSVLRIPKLYTRQRNQNILSDKLIYMQRILQGQGAIANLVEMEDYTSALSLIQEMKELYHHELMNINCMKEIGTQLDKYDSFISEVMCNKFVSLAIQFEETTTNEDDTVTSTSSTSQSPLMGGILDDMDPSITSNQANITLGSSLANNESFDMLLRSLISMDKLRVAINLYKSRLSDSVRLIVRTCILEYLSSFDPTLVVDALENSGSSGSDSSSSSGVDNTPFAARVREMTNENFLSCLSMCYENVLIAINKADVVHRFIETKLASYQREQSTDLIVQEMIADDAYHNKHHTSPIKPTSSSTSSSAGGENLMEAMITLSKSCLTNACDLAQRSIVQLLNLRKDSYSRMSVDKMKFLWEVSVHFVTAVEKVSGGASAYVMRQSLLTQTKHFLDSLHEGYKGRLINILDNEKWVQCDVSPERQHDIDRLVTGKSFLSKKSSSQSNLLSTSSSSDMINSSSTSQKKDARPARIDNASYNVVWSVLFLVEVILTYLDITISFPLITSELISKIIELIRLYDHRTRQLVLGAQAIQSAARLKSISARHLAITAQSIDFLSSLLPHIRTAILAQLSPKHHIHLQECDRISTELLDHHSAIVAKFVSIVSDFMDASAVKLRSVDWDRFQGQCEYFDEVIRNVSALHRVLLQLLPPELLQDIFQRIFSLLNRKIPMHFDEIMPNTQTGKQRILDDVSHVVTTFSRLKQIDCKQTTSLLEDAFKKRYGSSSGNNSIIKSGSAPTVTSTTIS